MKFQIIRMRNKQFRFVLVADNGELIDPRDSYTRKEKLLKAIGLIQSTTTYTPIEDLTVKAKK
jgi:uncharacterized protein YegP (UPF0339 family)